MNHLMLITC
uniref:Uncharacterized protein n=1 Tax=Anguilla anguilla TaxID=7936 RepID=A0A0E9XF08_ANGAN